MSKSSYPLFSVVGIELEYMIVDIHTLEIKPIADTVLIELAGHLTNEVELGAIAISNELVLHVIEFKTNGPSSTLKKLDAVFMEKITEVNNLLMKYDCCLLPTGAHPWLNPEKGIQLWPHGDRSIYEKYHEIFDCRGHGWSNLQSTHINLPFSSEEEFVKLHSAIRLLLPILPALTASTPFLEGKPTGIMDSRLDFYGKNQRKIPSITGDVIPEFVNSFTQYQSQLLQPMYQAISEYDPDKILQYEWLNSRGAIARFDRHAIEIRMMDIQECPLADISCIQALVILLKHIINDTHHYLESPLPSKTLKQIYSACYHRGMKAVIHDSSFLGQLGIHNTPMLTAKELWQILLNDYLSIFDPAVADTLNTLLIHGNLSERLLKAYEKTHQLPPIYQMLRECLAENRVFLP